ncbi:aminopeptidase O-like [Paramacrobiotus metropolitanus]|uniref:aminopeptidase O-like n=1 Tax=Paramacrobiotus metropolitanus TaxID=2943436 RepID=UPI0024459160|nr:aminopeptidase O-like [Paramacrobiotus metropolitanus]
MVGTAARCSMFASVVNSTSEDQSVDESELPLCANVRDVLVTHYSIQWTAKLREKRLEGFVLLHLSKPADGDNSETVDTVNPSARRCQELPPETSVKRFEIILDAYELDIKSAHILHSPVQPFQQLDEELLNHENLKSLHCTTNRWSVHIGDNVANFPERIVVFYSTKSPSCSLRWTVDDAARILIFTSGVLVNNRALLPCQDAPGINVTWDCQVKVLLAGTPDKQISLFMTGDHECFCGGTDQELIWRFSNSAPAPISTLGLLMGNFYVEEHSLLGGRLPFRLIYGVSQAACIRSVELLRYFSECLVIAEGMLGLYPFSQLSVWITSTAYESLGMAWPNLLFIHPAVLSPDGGMLVRIAHEVVHAWYGLSIGPRDWSEEWISEGFATFLEDIVHVEVMQRVKSWSAEECTRWLKRRELWKYRLLAEEIAHTPGHLQLLQQQSASSSVGNGLNCAKLSCQIHYLKGYFLLRHLEIVGKEAFMQFLKFWTIQHAGKFVLAEGFILDYYTNFARHLNYGSQDAFMMHLRATWLSQPGIPTEVEGRCTSAEMKLLIDEYRSVVKLWNCVFGANAAKSKRKLIIKVPASQEPLDTCLILDYLKELPELICPEDLQRLRKFYSIDVANADIRHIFCELIIINQCEPLWSFLKAFLAKEFAMGKCLYSMIMLSPVQRFRAIIPEVVNLVGADKDEFWWKEMKKIMNE